jgi:hypothetical protein
MRSARLTKTAKSEFAPSIFKQNTCQSTPNPSRHGVGLHLTNALHLACYNSGASPECGFAQAW